MRLTNSIHPVLNNWARRPSGSAASLFLRRIIATLTSSWLGGGISTSSSSIGFGTSLKAVLVMSSPCSRVEKCFLHNLSTPCGSVVKFRCSALQEDAFCCCCLAALLIVPLILLGWALETKDCFRSSAQGVGDVFPQSTNVAEIR